LSNFVLSDWEYLERERDHLPLKRLVGIPFNTGGRWSRDGEGAEHKRDSVAGTSLKLFKDSVAGMRYPRLIMQVMAIAIRKIRKTSTVRRESPWPPTVMVDCISLVVARMVIVSV
jgi:hypothetical protein